MQQATLNIIEYINTEYQNSACINTQEHKQPKYYQIKQDEIFLKCDKKPCEQFTR